MSKASGVRIEAPDVDPFLLGRPLDIPDRAGARSRDETVHQIAVAHGFVASHVEHLAVAAIGRAGAQERIGGIVDIHEVAQLGTVAEDLNLAALERKPDEPADEALPVVPNQLARTVDVRETQRAGANAEHVVVEQVVILAGGLVDAVDVYGADEMILVNGQPFGPSVNLSRSREHHAHGRGCASGTLPASTAARGS